MIVTNLIILPNIGRYRQEERRYKRGSRYKRDRNISRDTKKELAETKEFGMCFGKMSSQILNFDQIQNFMLKCPTAATAPRRPGEAF